MKKGAVFVGMLVAFAMGLVACSENSSSPETKKVRDYCKVVSTDPLVMESVEDGFFSRTTIKYENEKLVEKVEFDESLAAKMACESYQKDADYGNVVCSGNTIAAIGLKSMTPREYREVLTLFSTACGGDSLLDEISSSSEERFSSSVEKYSSSENYSSSSRTVKSSSSQGTESSSSEEIESSSDVQFSSSSETSLGEYESWHGKTIFKKEKVIAANASQLNCPQKATVDDLTGYDVAYEFDDPNDLGRDYLGKNTAYADAKTSPVSAECGSVVFDGTNGLLVPLTDTFKTRGFVVEARFMPTLEDDIGNIFAAEPPGGNEDGWLLRLENNGVTLYYRDVDQSYSWKSVVIGTVTLNEWHVVRVKIFPTKPEYGSIFYTMNVSLDGSVRQALAYNDDTSDLKFGLGIGFDSMYQDTHNTWFFTGKIDYIRYGAITEDDL